MRKAGLSDLTDALRTSSYQNTKGLNVSHGSATGSD
jgi:hypothetical protein